MTNSTPDGLPPLPTIHLITDPTRFAGASIRRRRIDPNNGYNQGVVGVVNDDEVVLGMFVANVPGERNYNNRTQEYEQPYFPELIFIVAKHPDQALRQAQQEAENLRYSQERAENACAKAQGEHLTAKKNFEDMARRAMELEQRLAQGEAQHDKLTESNRRLEETLGKVRTYVGDKAFKEATGT